MWIFPLFLYPRSFHQSLHLAAFVGLHCSVVPQQVGGVGMGRREEDLCADGWLRAWCARRRRRCALPLWPSVCVRSLLFLSAALFSPCLIVVVASLSLFPIAMSLSVLARRVSVRSSTRAFTTSAPRMDFGWSERTGREAAAAAADGRTEPMQRTHSRRRMGVAMVRMRSVAAAGHASSHSRPMRIGGG